MEPEVDAGFEFAFDNAAFSDKLLRIEVVGSSSSSSGDAPGSGADSASRKRRREEAQGVSIVRVNTININSAILAAKSPFFFKLFSNGMKESDQRNATLIIADSEENAFMEVLRFMYSGKLPPTTDPTLMVDIMVAADKFEVVSCMKRCAHCLTGLPMTPESALLCLDLPSSISMAAELVEAAKKFLSKRYNNFLLTELQDELMRVPLAGIVAILSRYDDVPVSEVSVYDFVLRWAFAQYPSSEERHNILSSHLLPLVSVMRVKTGVRIVDGLDYRHKFMRRRESCSKGFRSHFQKFRFAGHVFSLSAKCNMDSYNCFGLLLEMLEDKGPVKGTIVCKFEAKTRPLLQYVTMYECTSTDSREAVECKDLFGVPWSEFIADDSPFFVNGILHLQIHLKMM